MDERLIAYAQHAKAVVEQHLQNAPILKRIEDNKGKEITFTDEEMDSLCTFHLLEGIIGLIDDFLERKVLSEANTIEDFLDVIFLKISLL